MIDMREHDDEPIRGLPGQLPAGEAILWQGFPDWKVLFRKAFHARLVAIYFVLLAAAGLLAGSPTGALVTLTAGVVCLALLALLSWLMARTTVYTLTDRRLVFKVGVALSKCVNLPLKLVESADLRRLGGGHGDLSLTMGGDKRVGYVLLWPHVRPRKLRRPQPMLRAVPDADKVAALLTSACSALVRIEAPVAAEPRAAAPALPAGVAA